MNFTFGQTSFPLSTADLTATPTRDLSAQEILNALQSGTNNPEENRRLIVEAEVPRFTQRQLQTLKPILRQFILNFRDSSHLADHVAVGSAIRKYVANLTLDDLSEAAFLLEATPRLAPPVYVELEVAKMVVRKLTANPPEVCDSLPDLRARLLDLTTAYLNDPLLPREKLGAIALNATLALALMRSGCFHECLEQIRTLKSQWFIEHLASRSRALSEELAVRFAKDRIAEQLANLAELSAVHGMAAT